ncbi:MAG: HAD-IIIA family hydrolase [Candidatus Omnitrophica bacterium]|nr:HAD-IIIA family hydrolase [Candidatus Omnitrophota bacterium]
MIKVLFIDRDGVINKDPGGWTEYEYVTELKDFHFLPGALEALRLLNRNRIRVIVASNQAGVAKGYFTKDRLDEITRKMVAEAREAGGNIEEVCYCIHRNEDNCACRKPKPGLLETAMKKYKISPAETYFIGDSRVDVLAGRAAGVSTIFVLSGKTPQDEVKRWDVKPDYIFKDLLEAVKWLLARERRKSERSVKRKGRQRD